MQGLVIRSFTAKTEMKLGRTRPILEAGKNNRPYSASQTLMGLAPLASPPPRCWVRPKEMSTKNFGVSCFGRRVFSPQTLNLAGCH